MPRLAPAGLRIVWFFTISTTHLVFNSFSANQRTHSFMYTVLDFTNWKCPCVLLVSTLLHSVMLYDSRSSLAVEKKLLQSLAWCSAWAKVQTFVWGKYMGKRQTLKMTFYLRVGISPINKTGLTSYQPLSHTCTYAHAPCPDSVMMQHLAFKTPTDHFQINIRNGPNALPAHILMSIHCTSKEKCCQFSTDQGWSFINYSYTVPKESLLSFKSIATKIQKDTQKYI